MKQGMILTPNWTRFQTNVYYIYALFTNEVSQLTFLLALGFRFWRLFCPFSSSEVIKNNLKGVFKNQLILLKVHKKPDITSSQA